jgi:hypothetical protein
MSLAVASYETTCLCVCIRLLIPVLGLAVAGETTIKRPADTPHGTRPGLYRDTMAHATKTVSSMEAAALLESGHAYLDVRCDTHTHTLCAVVHVP